jgi:hypothetical protein
VPVPRTWLPRIYEILETLRSSSAREFQRPNIEKLFELQRRAALLLMKQAGAVRTQVHSAVPRQVLLAWVEKIEAAEAQDLVRRRQISDQIDTELEERRALRAALQEAGKPKIDFPLTREILEATLDSLPSGVQIKPGEIVIRFDPQDPVTACQLLYSLSMVLANDFDGFAIAMTAGRPVAREFDELVEPTVGSTVVQPSVQPSAQQLV